MNATTCARLRRFRTNSQQRRFQILTALTGQMVTHDRPGWIVSSVFVKLFGVINHDHVNGSLLSFQLEADLLLQSGEQGRA